MYSYDEERSIWLVSSLYQQLNAGYSASIRVFNLTDSSTPVFSHLLSIPTVVEEDSSLKLFELPDLKNVTSTYFLYLELFNEKKEALFDNFYWISTKPDVLNWTESNFMWTKCSSFADLTLLQSIPRVDVSANLTLLSVSSSSLFAGAKEVQFKVDVSNNNSKFVAFMVRFRILDPDTNDDILPVFWSDNYLFLLPSQKKTVTGSYNTFQSSNKLLGNLVVEVFNNISGGN